MGALSLKLAHPYQPSPKPLPGRPAHRHFRGLLGVYLRCGLHTRAVTNFVTAIRGLQTFRLLHACPGCFRLERPPGGACTRWKSAALSRRTWRAAIRQMPERSPIRGRASSVKSEIRREGPIIAVDGRTDGARMARPSRTAEANMRTAAARPIEACLLD